MAQSIVSAILACISAGSSPSTKRGSEEHLELLVADAGKERRICDLEAVEVQNRQYRAVRDGVDKFVAVPRGGERAGLGLAVADDAGGDQVGVIHHGAEGVCE
jgi:hypothetical protein